MSCECYTNVTQMLRNMQTVKKIIRYCKDDLKRQRQKQRDVQTAAEDSCQMEVRIGTVREGREWTDSSVRRRSTIMFV